MSKYYSSLPITYQGALHEYLLQPAEATLRQAYEFGGGDERRLGRL